MHQQRESQKGSWLRQTDSHQQWHGGSLPLWATFSSSLRSLCTRGCEPLLPFCQPRQSLTDPIVFHHRTCQRVRFCPRLRRKVKQNISLANKLCGALKDVCKSRGGRRPIQAKILSWMSIPFKGMCKTPLGSVSQHCHTEALTTSSSCFQKSSRHLSSYQQPAEAIKLTALSTALTCTESVLRGNKHLLK